VHLIRNLDLPISNLGPAMGFIPYELVYSNAIKELDTVTNTHKPKHMRRAY